MMKIRSLFPLALLLSTAACDDDPTAPFCATIDTPATLQLTSQTTAEGSVASGPLQGAVRAEITGASAGEGGVQNLTMRHTFVTAPGDSLFTEDTAVLTPVTETQVTIDEELVVQRGTGLFRGVTGTLNAASRADLATGQIEARYTGELCGLRD